MRIKIACPMHPGESGQTFCTCEGRLGRTEGETCIKSFCNKEQEDFSFFLTKEQIDDIMQSRQTKIFHHGQIIYVSPIVQKRKKGGEKIAPFHATNNI